MNINPNMEIIKNYTAIQVSKKRVNDTVQIQLSYGDVTGPYYSLQHPEEIFQTEEEAIEYAYKKNPHINWLIVPIISFVKIY